MRRFSFLAVVGPGILVAATGVGAGDLATAAFTGSALGTTVLWAVAAGAFVKFVLNEGLTRFQLATGETLIEGTVRRLGRAAGCVLLLYLVPWTFLVAAALMSACGAAAHAILPLFSDPTRDKILYGILHSAVGVLLVRIGGYRLFEKVMSVAVGLMFVTVVVTAARIGPDPGAFLPGLFLPTIPAISAGGLAWTVALLGGVGGTVTILCYGYWIREEGRLAIERLGGCRIDLGVGYVMTALFGLAMVVIGARVGAEGRGVGLIVGLADTLRAELGPAARAVFLAGAWSAVASSLLGVWQAVPYLFADLVDLLRETPRAANDAREAAGRRAARDRAARAPGSPARNRAARAPGDSPRDAGGATGAPPRGMATLVASPVYRAVLYAMATIPAIGLGVGFARMQKLYAIVGALFLPMLALGLLVLGGRRHLGPHANRPLTRAVLAIVFGLFALAFWFVVT